MIWQTATKDKVKDGFVQYSDVTKVLLFFVNPFKKVLSGSVRSETASLRSFGRTAVNVDNPQCSMGFYGMLLGQAVFTKGPSACQV